MTELQLILFDVAAIAALVFGLYFPRHHRRDMVVAYLTVNIGVLAVSEALLASTVSAGLGLGLFGVLSIIRLRSEQLEQHEVAYYFGSLALGLLGGLTTSATWVSPALMGLVVVALYVGDHPQLFASYRSQSITLDRAYMDTDEVRQLLSVMLDAKVHQATITKVDLVRDTTTVDVRYQVRAKRDRHLAAADVLVGAE